MKNYYTIKKISDFDLSFSVLVTYQKRWWWFDKVVYTRLIRN